MAACNIINELAKVCGTQSNERWEGELITERTPEHFLCEYTISPVIIRGDPDRLYAIKVMRDRLKADLARMEELIKNLEQ